MRNQYWKSYIQSVVNSQHFQPWSSTLAAERSDRFSGEWRGENQSSHPYLRALMEICLPRYKVAAKMLATPTRLMIVHSRVISSIIPVLCVGGGSD